ncbi:MAG: sugar ABC transporter permease [Myxococcota bacterium]|nr:sugar ABC transporter permease [Myxococcota bacterium]
MKQNVRLIISGIFAFGLTYALGFGAQSVIKGQFEQVEVTRAILDAHQALKSGPSDKQNVTIVKETKSAKYHFLNKRSYEVNTADSSRAGTVLTGENDQDKARADRHSDARRTKKPVVQRLKDGSVRVTVADGMKTSEVLVSESLPVVPFSWGIFFAISICLFIASIFAAKKTPVVGSVVLLAGLAISTGVIGSQYLGLSAAEASEFLRAGGRRAPAVVSPSGSFWGTLAAIYVAGAIALVFIATSAFERSLDSVQRSREAYVAISPAMLGLFVLVGIPFVVGIGLAFFRHVHGDYSFVGLDNFRQILTGSEGPHSIFYTLVVTVIWTFLNVILHLSVGLGFALLLHKHASGWTRIYRVILIIPWAVPAYLTALIWRSMFDADIGVINRILGLEGMSWMHDTFTAFCANLITNVWLGFPFMMVVCLGALTSIPGDLYDAADVDGANGWQKFTQITLPLLKPALLPATILGSIWTFNKFEVIYLVSEGRPDGGTDILVTEAYRWAFERGLAQGGAYGKAAACSVIIFLVLLVYGWMTARVSRSAEEALR